MHGTRRSTTTRAPRPRTPSLRGERKSRGQAARGKYLQGFGRICDVKQAWMWVTSAEFFQQSAFQLKADLKAKKTYINLSGSEPVAPTFAWLFAYRSWSCEVGVGRLNSVGGSQKSGLDCLH